MIKTQRAELTEERDKLRAELAQVQASVKELVDGVAAQYVQGRADERADVIAWARRKGWTDTVQWINCGDHVGEAKGKKP